MTVLPQLSGYLTAVGYHEGQDVQKGQFLAQIDPRQYRDQQTAGPGDPRQRPRCARAGACRPRPLHAVERAQVDRRADLCRPAIPRAAGRGRSQGRPRQHRPVRPRPRLLPHHRAGRRRVGLRLVDPGNYVTASSSPGIVVITTMKPTTVQFTVPQDSLAYVCSACTAARACRSPPIQQRQLEARSPPARCTRSATRWRRRPAPSPCAPRSPTTTRRCSRTSSSTSSCWSIRCRTPCWCRRRRCKPARRATMSIWSMPNNTVSVHKVTLGPSDGKNTVITSGLAAGNMVVTDGTDRLSDGAQDPGGRSRSPRRGASAPARQRRPRRQPRRSSQARPRRRLGRSGRGRCRFVEADPRADEYLPPVYS